MIGKHREILRWASVLATLVAWPTVVWARPEAPRVLCGMYPDAVPCSGRIANCSTCHISTWPPSWNDFGLQVASAMMPGPYEEALSNALSMVADLDADGDGVSNEEEFKMGTAPGDIQDVGPTCSAPPSSQPLVSEGYDYARAYRRLHILYCGQSPSFEQLTQFEADASTADQRYEAMHAALEACLGGSYWQNEGLPRIADPLIRPISTFGRNSNVGLPFSDYEWDYRLFSYVMTQNRDVRDLLLADYHVQSGDDGDLARVEGVIPGDLQSALFRQSGGQPLEPQHRAGMITTQWFLVHNTMGSAMPRITAAQAYRAYLGFDIAKLQGILPVANEPKDVDHKGVTERRCALCHSTL
ncbi:MAG: hypothetical protein AAF449_22560, partial [Myxococcota bacterium]